MRQKELPSNDADEESFFVKRPQDIKSDIYLGVEEYLNLDP
tara:strand:- start:1013 stop:1135 length:123 start_codon:yes stop_codon:yes gene_type:complete